jgi:hypothetical protein
MIILIFYILKIDPIAIRPQDRDPKKNGSRSWGLIAIVFLGIDRDRELQHYFKSFKLERNIKIIIIIISNLAF